MVSKQRGPTNPVIASLVGDLRIASRKNEAPIWRTIADRLVKPRRQRSEVNLSKINRYTTDNESVVVPGKVLATGELSHKVTVAAIGFSSRAKEKIEAAGGKALSISDLMDENPKGSKVRILA
jgi:large subunit ribosomal protein L18e